MEEKLEKPPSIKILQWVFWLLVAFIIVTVILYGYIASDLIRDQCWDGYPGRDAGPYAGFFCPFNPKEVLLKISLIFITIAFFEMVLFQLLRKRLRKQSKIELRT